jgi:hypothetical protein
MLNNKTIYYLIIVRMINYNNTLFKNKTKKMRILLFFLILNISSFAQLSGTKTIGPTFCDFINIQAACNALNTFGVNGAVTFKIKPGIYTETIFLDQVSGVSATNTITFQSDLNDASTVTVQSSDSAVFVSSVSFLRFKNLSFLQSGTGKAIQLYGSDYTINTCLFDAPASMDYLVFVQKNTGYIQNVMVTNSVFNSANGLGLSGANVKSLTLMNNTYTVDNYANYIYADSLISNVAIYDLHVNDSEYGVYLEAYYNKVKNVTIGSSTIHSYFTAIEIQSNQIVEDVDLYDLDITGNYPISSIWNYGININGSNGKLSNIDLLNVNVSQVYGYGILLSSQEEFYEISLVDCVVESSYFGVMLAGSNEIMEDVEIANTTITTENGYGLAISGFYGLKNFNLVNDSIISNSGTGLYLYSTYGQISDIRLQNMFIKQINNNSCCNSACNIVADYGAVNQVVMSESNLKGYYGLNIKSFSESSSISVLDSEIFGVENGVLFVQDGDMLTDFSLIDSKINSVNAAAINLEGLNSRLNNFILLRDTIQGYNGIGIAFKTGINGINFSENSIMGTGSEGINLYGEYMGSKNIQLENNYIYGVDLALYINQDYQDLQLVTLKGNTIEADLGYVFNNAMTISSNFSKVEQVEIQNNQIQCDYNPVYMSAFGGINNSHISNNDFRLSNTMGYGYGVMIDNLSKNVFFSNNTVDVINGGTGYEVGFYLSGTNQFENSVFLNGNYIANSIDKAIEIEYCTGTVSLIENRIENNLLNSKMVGVRVNHVDSLILSSNEYYTTKEGVALSFKKLAYGMITNNMFRGFDLNMYASESKNVMLAHNSFYSSIQGGDSSMISLDLGCENIDVLNNIFQVNSDLFTGNQLWVYATNVMGSFLNNVYNADFSISNYALIQNSNIMYNTLEEWKNALGKEINSFVYSVLFVDSLSNLRLECGQNVLQAGLPNSGVAYDIDSNYRLAIPTIGAFENINNLIFESDTVYTCSPSIDLTVNLGIGETAVWSTGEIGSSITTDGYGIYWVDISDDCTTVRDSIIAAMCPEALALTKNSLNTALSVYPNPATNNFILSGIESGIAYDIVLTSLTGQVVQNYFQLMSDSNEMEFNIEEIPSGVYWIRVINQNTEEQIQLVKI